jgi:nicotinamide mononucleotide transporter
MEVFNFIFGQYATYKIEHIVLELVAIAASVISVLYSKKNSILVYPYGILSTGIFVYLLIQWELPGDMIINGYYFIMSIYGWYYWSKKIGENVVPITRVTQREWIISGLIFIASTVLVYYVYIRFEMLNSWINYVDILTTGIAFVGMWQMALRKLEYWLVLLVANVISVPLYFIKGYSFTAFLFIFLTIIAYKGYMSWKTYHINAPLKG